MGEVITEVTEQPVILITGTSKGIGKYLAEQYVAKGYQVAGCSRQTVDREMNGYEHYCADVADEEQVKSMVSAIQRRHGRLDVVINNAGVASMNHCLLTPASTVERIFGTNFRGTFLVSRESAKLMKAGRFGRIVNIGSVAVPMRLEGESVYAASKSAIITYTQIIARELAEFGITCNTVALTPIETDLIRSIPREKINRIIDNLAIKRLGRVDDVLNVIDFFIKPESDYITGQVVHLGGV